MGYNPAEVPYLSDKTRFMLEWPWYKRLWFAVQFVLFAPWVIDMEEE